MADGDLIAETDDTGTVIWTATYTPFGLASINSDPDNNGTDYVLNFRLPGQYYDAETWLLCRSILQRAN